MSKEENIRLLSNNNNNNRDIRPLEVSNDVTIIDDNNCNRLLNNSYIKIFTIISLIIIIIILFIIFPFNYKSSYEIINLQDKLLLYISAPEYGLYLRQDSTKNNNKIVLTETIPWIYGSTFQVVSNDNKCFKLRTMNNNYIKIDYESGNIISDNIDKTEASDFTAVTFKHNNNDNLIGLKVCSRDEWISVMSDNDNNYNLVLSPESHENNHYYSNFITNKISTLLSIFHNKLYHHTRNLRSTTNNNYNGLEMPLSGSLFSIEKVKHVEGVNLGGWFIPEAWMNKGFYNGTGLGWGGSLCGIVNYNRSLAEHRMADHLANWIKENDFHEIVKYGFNSVRLPIGYWNVIDDPLTLFAPADTSVSLSYIDWAFDMADKYNITVLLDLHGAPGSQNGIDHSGCGASGANWLESKDNLKLTLDTIEVMMSRYGERKSFYGIELVNEPSLHYSEDMHSDMVSFYHKAYSLIRNYNTDCVIVFNELYEKCYKLWQTELQEPSYYNVIMDVHLYDWQEPYTSETIPQHIEDAEHFAATITELTPHHPVIVGEWSFSTGIVVQAGQDFVDACVESFSHSSGWYIWNWKIELDVGFDEWNVQLQHSLKHGMTAI